MMRYLMMIATLVAFALPAQAQDGGIQGVISQQIEAFQKDDFNRAYSFASPTIQKLFGSPQNFGRMVTNGYPMVYRPKSVTFRGLVDTQFGPVQTVIFEDQAGRVFVGRYSMVKTESGWKIDGVTIEQDTGVGA